MSTKPISFLRETLPTLFDKGMTLLRSRADGGDTVAKQLLDNVLPVEGGAHIAVEGEGDVFVAVQGGKMTTADAPIAGVPIKVAFKVPGDAASLVLGEAAKEGALDNDKVAIGITQVANKELEDALAGRELTCHLTLKDTPELDDVTVWIGLNVTAPPATPKFTCTLNYDDYEELRAGKANLQQAFMQGKLKMTGDYSVALQIAMAMAAKAQQRAKSL